MKMNEKSTEELFTGFKNERNIGDFLEKNSKEFPENLLTDHINRLLFEKDLQPADILEKSGLSHSYVYDISNGRRKPSRDSLIALAFGMGLNLEETSLLLKKGGYRELYARDKCDGIIIHCITNSISIVDCNLLLEENNLESLIKERTK